MSLMFLIIPWWVWKGSHKNSVDMGKFPQKSFPYWKLILFKYMLTIIIYDLLLFLGKLLSFIGVELLSFIANLVKWFLAALRTAIFLQLRGLCRYRSKWGSDGVRSELYGGCNKTSNQVSSIFSESSKMYWACHCHDGRHACRSCSSICFITSTCLMTGWPITTNSNNNCLLSG